MASRIEAIKGVKEIKRADGTTAYQITVSKGIDPRTGKQKRRYRTYTPLPGMSKKEIADAIEAVRVELGARLINANTKASRQSFTQFATAYIERKEASGKFKARTAATYRYLLEVIDDDFGNLPLNEITPEVLDAFLNRLRTEGAHNGKEYATAKPAYREALAATSAVKIAEKSGVSVATVRSAKHGQRITGEKARKIADALGAKADTLFSMEKKQTVLAEGTISLYLHLIGGVFKDAKLKRLITENPCNYVERPTVETPEQRAFDEAEQDAILAAADQQPLKWRCIIYLLTELGLRRGELCALRWSDFDFNRGIVTIAHSLSYTPDKGIFLDTTKTRNTRTLNMSDTIMTMLKQYKAEQARYILACCGEYDNQGFLFTQPDGRPSNPEHITGWFCRFAKRSGLHIHAHSFRHNAASTLIAMGADLVTTAGILGHASADTTAKCYAHTIERTKALAQKEFVGAIYRRKQA